MAALTTGRVRVRGAELVYEQSGTGPDLIWGHGLSMNRASDTDMGLLDWSRIPVTVVRYDARGHGESESTPDLDGYSWEELARDQLALADELGIGSYVAAGASLGCGTALLAAGLGGSRVRALVLVIPPTAWETRAAQAEQWGLAATTIETQGVEAMIAARADVPPPDPYVGDELRAQQRDAATRAWDPKRLAHVMRGATRANFPDRDAIATISVPTLILAWTGDAIHPAGVAEELDGLLPQAKLHVASTRAAVDTWSDLTREFLAEALS